LPGPAGANTFPFVATTVPAAVHVRPFTPADDVSALTALLHRAYGPLAEQGLRFLATWQDDERTRRRIAEGECYLACDGGAVVGTVLLRGPGASRGTPWYERPDVAVFGQFGIEPSWQRRGVGSRLLDFVERRAVELGAAA
jgi:GNAT superfamily N-acetyltransferase